MANGTPEEISQDLQNKLVKLGYVSETLAAAWGKGAKSAKAMEFAIENLSSVIQKNSKLTEEEAKVKAKEILEAEREVGRVEQRNKAMKDAGVKAVDAVKQFASGAVSAAQGAINSSEVFTGASATLGLIGNTLKSVTDILATAVSGIPFIGGALSAADKAVGLVADVAIQVAQMQLEQAQKYVNTYQSLSKVGLSFGGDLETARRASVGAGISLERFQKFTTESAEALATMGGGMVKTAGIIGKMGKEVGQTNANLLLQYGSYEALDSALATFASRAAGFGFDIVKNQKELKEGSIAYLQRLNELTEVTGIQADRAQKEERERASSILFQNKLEELQTQFDPKTWLQIKDQINNTLSMVGENMSQPVMKIFQDAFARGGINRLRDPDSIALFARNPELVKAFNRLNESMLDKNNTKSQIDSAKAIGDFIASEKGKKRTTDVMEGGAETPGVIKTEQLMAATAKGKAGTGANLEKAVADAIERQKFPDSPQAVAYRKALDEKMTLEQKQNKITQDNLGKMGDFAKALYEFNQILVEKFGDFGGAVADFGNYVEQLLNQADPGREKRRKAEVARDNLHKDLLKANVETIKTSKDAQDVLNNKRLNPSDYGGKEFLESMAAGRKPEQKGYARPNLTGMESDPEALFKAKIKKGIDGAMAPGKQFDGRLADMLNQYVSEKFPIDQITGLNDKYHEGTDSRHAEGKAVDFTLGNTPTDKDGQEIVKQLRKLGFNHAIDEYNHPSKAGVAGHIHAQLKEGGITKGPSLAGEAGPEAVIPLPDGRTVPVKMDMGDLISKLEELITVNKDQLNTSEKIHRAVS